MAEKPHESSGRQHWAGIALAGLGVAATIFAAEKALPRFMGSANHIQDVADTYTDALSLLVSTAPHQKGATRFMREVVAVGLMHSDGVTTAEIKLALNKQYHLPDWDPVQKTLRVLSQKGVVTKLSDAMESEWWQVNKDVQQIFREANPEAVGLNDVQATRNKLGLLLQDAVNKLSEPDEAYFVQHLT